MHKFYPALFTRDEGPTYSVEFPDLPGCATQGDNAAEAMVMAMDAAAGWMAATAEDPRVPELPTPSRFEDIARPPDGTVQLVPVRMPAGTTDVTVALENGLLDAIDRKREDRSDFVNQAVRLALHLEDRIAACDSD